MRASYLRFLFDGGLSFLYPFHRDLMSCVTGHISLSRMYSRDLNCLAALRSLSRRGEIFCSNIFRATK